MKVALLTTDSREYYRSYLNARPFFGAAPEALLQGFRGLPDLEIHIVSCARAEMQSPSQLADNIMFHSLVVPKHGWLRTGYQGCIRKVRSKLRMIQPDIVHGQGTERDCALEAVTSGFPNVITIHGNMAELARLFRARPLSFAWIAAKLETFALRRTVGVFCHSAYTESLVKPRAKKTWRVPNPVREEFFTTPVQSPTPTKCRILNIGLVTPRKRQVELLELARKLHSDGSRFELQFIGEADPSKEYGAKFLQLIEEARPHGYASYLGSKSTAELINCFDNASGLVHFPLEEAFGLVVAEALARNLKFFGARVGGITDICAGVSDAELVEVNDWVTLGEHIKRWVTSGFPRSKSATALMRERFHPATIARRHVEIYREVLGLG